MWHPPPPAPPPPSAAAPSPLLRESSCLGGTPQTRLGNSGDVGHVSYTTGGEASPATQFSYYLHMPTSFQAIR